MFFAYLYALITAPGVAMHELGHALFCWLSGVKIHKIKLFQFGQVAGYVRHDDPQYFYQHILVSFGPLIVNTIVAMVLFAGIKMPYVDYHTAVYGWLAIAIGLHAIPSTGDAEALWRATGRRFWHNPLVVVALPLVVALYFLNLLKRWHIHFLYTGFLALLAYWLKQ